MKIGSLMALNALAAAAPNPVQAPRADTPAPSATAKLFLPTAAPGSNDAQAQEILASVIKEYASATEYLLACATAFSSPEDCDGPYTGVTLTHGASTMGIKLDDTTYACSHGDGKEAVCAIKADDGSDEATTLAAAEAEKWVTPVVVVSEPTLPAEVEGAVNAAKGGRGGSSGSGRKSGGGGGGIVDDDEDAAGSLAISWGVLAAAAGIAALM